MKANLSGRARGILFSLSLSAALGLRVGISAANEAELSATPTAPLRISEFMAENAHGIRDEDGDNSDWIEIFNPGLEAVDLAGWSLTDDPTNPGKWSFPPELSAILGPNRYLLLWASGKNRTAALDRLHTNFRLDKNGEYLALVSPSQEIVSAFAPAFPPQAMDSSYGRDAVDPSLTGYYNQPTPGAPNTIRGAGFAAEPAVAPESGIFTNTSVQVVITHPGGEDTMVRYTLNGTEPTNGSPAYAGPFTVTSNVLLKVRAFQNGLWPSPIVARSYIFLDASAADFNSNLPIIILGAGRPIPDNVPPGVARARGSLVVIDTFRGRTSLRSAPQYQGPGQFEIFGQTAAGFPKVPYNIEVNDEFGNDRSISLLGFPPDADFKLDTKFSDKSLMNEFLALELHEQMGYWAPRRKFVEVFADQNVDGKITYPGDYVGVYMFCERIERDRARVNIQELTPAHNTEPEITGGYIIKKDKDSAGDLNFTIPGLNGFANQFLKLHEPKPREITPTQLRWLTNWLTLMAQSLYASNWLSLTGTNHYSNYLDVDSAVDQHWIVEFTKNIDGYRLSRFWSKDRNGKLVDSPIWDFDLAFGNANYLQGGMTNGWYWNEKGEGMTSAEHVWHRRLLYGVPNIVGNGGAFATVGDVENSGDPVFIQKVIDRWGALRSNILNGPRVVQRVDELAALLGEGAARNYAKYPVLGTALWPNPNGGIWHVDYVNPTTYTGIVAEVKKWITGRYNWLDAQFVRAPEFAHPGGPVTFGTAVSLSRLAGNIYYTLDGTDPRTPNGNISPTARLYSSPIPIASNTLVFARARNGSGQYSWSPPAVRGFYLYDSFPALRISEIMYHPDPSASPAQIEFIELKNTGASALELRGFTLSGSVAFTCPEYTLAPGARALVVQSPNNQFGNGFPVLGEFSGELPDAEGTIVLSGPAGEPIQAVEYLNTWYPLTDGFGFSLVANEPSYCDDCAGAWHPSPSPGGSPGESDPPPPAFARVVINEILSHSHTPLIDTVELQNLSNFSADIGSWFLTDDFRTPKKFQIPAGTTIAANGFMVFDETQFNASGIGFAFNSLGDEVYLFSANASGELTGYAHGFRFGAAAQNATLGRYVDSFGREHLVPQAANTLLSSNSPPAISPLVISEVLYTPPLVVTNGSFWDNTEDEYVELVNRSGAAIQLFDLAHPAGRWRLGDQISFEFPPNLVLAAGEYLLIVSFDPENDPAQLQAFRSRYAVPPGVRILGPYQGSLANKNGNLALYMPEGAPVRVENIAYTDDDELWPFTGAGLGLSLTRMDTGSFADDPTHWGATAPNPGRAFVAGPNPVITSQPQSQTAIDSAGDSVSFSVGVSGEGPFRYQWMKDSELLHGQTASTLTIHPTSLADAGEYSVVVFDPKGFSVSSSATLTVLVGVRVSQQPASLSVYPGSNVTFKVVASSSTPIAYQWQFNGSDLLNETNDTLRLNNVTNIHDGLYRVRMTDAVGPVHSLPARLTVRLRPRMIEPVPPLHLTAVEGETIRVHAQLFGTMPIFTRWRFVRESGGNTIYDNQFTDSEMVSSLYTASNGSGHIVLHLTNSAGGVLSAGLTNAFLSVLADTDHDKIPDDYEIAHGLDFRDASDAGGDTDGDLMSNRDEYIAGTDPQDPLSYLRIESISAAGSAALQFHAVSNHSYRIEFSDAVPGATWAKLSDVLARATNFNAAVLDSSWHPRRYYRLATPIP